MKDICEIAKMFKAEEIYNTGLAFIQKNIDPNFFVPDNKYNESDGKTYLKLIGENDVIQNDQEEEKPDNATEDNEKKENDEKEEPKSVLYVIRVENHTFKCPTFKFVFDNRIRFTAKQKSNEIYIAEGSVIHIHKRENHVAYVHQNEYERSNSITLRDIKFNLNYVNTAVLGHYSIDVSFPYNNHTEHWVPRKPRFDQKTNKYYLNFGGDYHHTAINSAKNLILQNMNGHLTYIVRKIDRNVHEIECNQALDPLFAFSIGISDIIGPYDDPWKFKDSYEL